MLIYGLVSVNQELVQFDFPPHPFPEAKISFVALPFLPCLPLFIYILPFHLENSYDSLRSSSKGLMIPFSVESSLAPSWEHSSHCSLDMLYRLYYGLDLIEFVLLFALCLLTRHELLRKRNRRYTTLCPWFLDQY